MGVSYQLLFLMLMKIYFAPLSLILVPHFTSECEISVKNVGMKAFTWHIEYAGGYIHERNLTSSQHDNYECACVPHDMKIIYQVEVTDYAIYINVGHENVEMCAI